MFVLSTDKSLLLFISEILFVFDFCGTQLVGPNGDPIEFNGTFKLVILCPYVLNQLLMIDLPLVIKPGLASLLGAVLLRVSCMSILLILLLYDALTSVEMILQLLIVCPYVLLSLDALGWLYLCFSRVWSH